MGAAEVARDLALCIGALFDADNGDGPAANAAMPPMTAASSAKRRSPCNSMNPSTILSMYCCAVGRPFSRLLRTMSYAFMRFPPSAPLPQARHAAAGAPRAGRASPCGRRCGRQSPFSCKNSARWKPGGSFLPDGLLDDARAGKADERTLFGDDDVRLEGKRRRHAARSRVGEHRNIQQARLVVLGDGRTRLGHLHEGNDALLHARAAA